MTEYIHLLRRQFPTCCLSFRQRPRKKCARVSHEMAKFVLKIAHLAILMEAIPFAPEATLRCILSHSSDLNLISRGQNS